MVYDNIIQLSVGNSRKATVWAPQTLLWSELLSRIATPQRTEETIQTYFTWPKQKQDELKDVGGYVGGTLTGGRRKNECAGERYLITLDADTIEAGGTQRVIHAVAALGCAYALYSTRKHVEAAPRLRLLFPLDRPCSSEEYEAVARKLASLIDLTIFDPTTFEPVRLMYWPSCSADSNYVFCFEDKPYLSVDGMLSFYHNWRNISEWPVIPGAAKLQARSARKQGDPLHKTGIVGAFCKTYSIPEAMDLFLPGVYEPCTDGRYTFVGGSTVGGAVLYEEKFLYSHHSTDPCSGKLCNAFDLVRLHLFGDEDLEAQPDTPVNRLPSFARMCEYVSERDEIKQLLIGEKMEHVQKAFGTAPAQVTEAAYDPTWINQLVVSPTKGIPVSTPFNMKLILEHDPALVGKFYLDEFAGRIFITAQLPWDVSFLGYRVWGDEDDSGLRNYFSDVYGISGKEKIGDALAEVIHKTKRHPIRGYLASLQWDGVPRVDTLLTDYLGAFDNVYTRAVIRKALTAAVARVFCPGIKYDTMLILSGKQGVGKSTFWSRLGMKWYSDSLTTFEGKEASELLQGYWIIEVGELAGLNRSEMNTIKGFLSKQEDVYRAPYGRHTVPHPRSCIIVGTTNDMEYLRDKTGNRRFWPVDLGKVESCKNVWQDLAGEVDQIWAEAVEYYKLGEPLYLSKELEKYAEEVQEEHRESDPKEGIILNFLETPVPPDWNSRDEDSRRIFYMNAAANVHLCTAKRDRICAVELWVECFRQDKGRMKNADARDLNAILRHLPGWEEVHTGRKTAAYGGQRIFRRQSTAYDL